LVLDLDHAAENRPRVAAVRECLNDDPETLYRARVFLREAYDALGDTGPLALGVPGEFFVQVHDCVEQALLGDDSSPGAPDAARRALRYLEVILAVAAKPRGREQRPLRFVVGWALAVVMFGAYVVGLVTSDLIGPLGLKRPLLEAFGIAFAVWLLIWVFFLSGRFGAALRTRWRRTRRHRTAEIRKMASQRIDTGGSGGTQPSAEPVADASPASEDYGVGRWKPLDGVLARLDYGPVVRVLARRAIGCEEPLHRFWAVVVMRAPRCKRLVVATRSRLWIIDHRRFANAVTVGHTIAYSEITGVEKRVFPHDIHVNIETREGPVCFRWGSGAALCRAQADALAIILRRRSHLPAPTVRTRKRFSRGNLQRVESSSAAEPGSGTPVEK
jgi:hypothetical protein